MAESAIVGADPRAPSAVPDSRLSAAQLAAKYGLTVAGARPGVVTYLRRVWAYRHFIAAFADARLVAAFATARLGRLWQVLTPLTNAAVYYVIFGVILNTSHGVDNFIGYLCAGVFVFNYTSLVLSTGVQAIAGNLSLVRALHFPRACLPIALSWTQLQNMITSMVVLAGIVLATGEPLAWRWLLVVPALILQTVFNIGLAMVLARLGSKVTDIRQVLPFALRIWMYASGVMYSVEMFDRNLPTVVAEVLKANPLLSYVELARVALLESPPLSASTGQMWLLAAGWAVAMGVGGFLYFWHGEQEYGRG